MRDYLLQKKCTKNIIRLFSKRARDYIVSYHLLTHKNDDVKDSVMKGEKDNDPVVIKVEKMRKLSKTYRCTIDFDSRFIKTVVECKIIDLTNED